MTEKTSHVSRSESSRYIASFDYRDERGVLIYQVRLTDGGRYRPRQPDGVGGWTRGWAGVQPILFRLPELIAADPQAPVYLAVNESDAERFRGMGLIATCCPPHRRKWEDRYVRYLRGRHVVALHDGDRGGIARARHIAAALKGVAASVLVMPMPAVLRVRDAGDQEMRVATPPMPAPQAIRSDTAMVPVGGGHISKVEEASQFLTVLLADGPMPQTTVAAHAARAGISKATLRRAADELQVHHGRVAFSGGWSWSLPE